MKLFKKEFGAKDFLIYTKGALAEVFCFIQFVPPDQALVKINIFGIHPRVNVFAPSVDDFLHIVAMKDDSIRVCNVDTRIGGFLKASEMDVSLAVHVFEQALEEDGNLSA